MKINAIPAISNYTAQSNKNVTPAFKGLWGNTPVFKDERYDNIHENHYTFYKYYPFKDESDEHIEEIRKKHSYERHYLNENWKKHSDPQAIHEQTIVSVQDRLPITTQEFEDYRNNNLVPADREIIRFYLREYGLVDLEGKI